MMQTSRFSFVDEGEALRRLNVDRDTLLGLVNKGRIRAYPGVGKGNFYRMRDLDALYEELYGGAPATGESEEGEKAVRGKPFDPAYKVHVRLQADLKWYDLSDEELRAWVREMHADGYPRQRANIEMVMDKLQRLIALMDEAAANWQVLKPTLPPAPQQVAPTEQTPAVPTPSRRGKSLPMLGGPTSPASPSPTVQAPVPPSAPPPTPSPRRGKPLPLLGGVAPPDRGASRGRERLDSDAEQTER